MIYYPLRYTATAKYSRLWFFDQLVFVDMLMPIAATSYDARTLLLHLVCIPFYVLSFMCVYEIGYFENDMRAARSEKSPVLTDQVHRFHGYRIEPYAWIYAIVFAGIGASIIVYTGSLPHHGVWVRSALWIAILVSVRIVFRIYNNKNENDRPTLYFVLQLFKYGSVLVIFAPTIFGVVITSSQIVAISLVYWVYRAGGRQKSLNREKIRLTLAFGFGALLALGGATTSIDSLVAALIAGAWLLLRLGKPALMSYLRDRDGRS
jgi:hypothetical protein